MRNLKKVLSLALAMVMLLGMMVIGAGAVETQFADNDKVGETYKEAVAVMTEVGVLTGKENNNFDPEGTLTRAEAATILVRVTMGTEAAKGLAGVTKSGVFTDMSNHWAAGYVDACFNKGIVGGIGNSLYAPDSKLTGTQFAAMLMRAAGVEGDFTGSSWESAVIAAAAKAKLSEVTTGEISRQSAAKMAFDGVLYSPSGEKSYKVGNLTFDNFLEAYIANGSKTEGIDVSTASDSLAKTVLGLTEDTQEDKFGNPQKVWKVDDKVVVTVPGVKSDKAFTAPFTANDLKDYKCADDMVVMIDGVKDTSVKSVDNIVAKSGNGVEVNIYASNKVISKVVVVNPYVGEVTRVTEASGDTKRSVTVGGLKFETEDFAKDDVVLYTKADGKIQSMYLLNPIEGATVTRKTGSTSFVADGETYKYTDLGSGSVTNPAVNNVVDVYLDQYGFAAKVEINKGYSDFAYVAAAREVAGYSTTYYARLVMTDGTVVEDAKLSNTLTKTAGNFDAVGMLVKFTKNAKDVYTLDLGDTATNKTSSAKVEIENGKRVMTLGPSANAATVYANSKTIFLIQDNNTKEWSAYTGYADVPNIDIASGGEYTARVSASVASIVVVPNAPVSSNTSLFVLNVDTDEVKDEDGTYYVYPAVMDGEITTVKLTTALAANKLFDSIVYDNESAGIIDNGIGKSHELASPVTGKVTALYDDGLIWIDSANKTVAEDVEVYKLSTTAINAASIEEIEVGADVTAIEKDGELVSVFFTPKAAATTYTVNPSAHVEIRTTNSGWTGEATATAQTVNAGTVYVKAVKGWAIDTSATTAVTLSSVGSGVYSFTASGNVAADAIKTKEVTSASDANIEVRDVTEGYSVTRAHIITAAECGTGKEFADGSAGKLYIEFTAPNGITLNTSAKPTVTLSIGNVTRTITMGNNTLVAGKTYSTTSSSAVDGWDGTAYLDFTAAAPTHYAVQYNLDAVPGYSLVATTDEKLAVSGDTVTFTLKDGNGVFVDGTVKYTVKNGDAAESAEITKTSSGKEVTTDSITPTGTVIIKIKSITPTKVTGEVVNGANVPAGLWTVDSNSVANPTAGLSVANDGLDLQTAGQAITLDTGIKSAKVKVSITGATKNDGTAITNPIDAEITSGHLVIAQNGKFKPTGTAKVIVTITEVTEITLDKSTAFVIGTIGEIDGQTADTIAVDADVVLKKVDGAWKNSNAFKITLSKSANGTAGNVQGQITAISGAAIAAAKVSTNKTANDANISLEFDFVANDVTFNTFGSAFNVDASAKTA